MGEKKIEKLIKSRKSNYKKKSIKLIKILKKLIGSSGFGFISLKPKKLNWTQTEKTGKKQSQTKKNRTKPGKTESNQKTSQISLNRFLS
jgi:hypothetical protein